jgi:hypothetical protein
LGGRVAVRRNKKNGTIVTACIPVEKRQSLVDRSDRIGAL